MHGTVGTLVRNGDTNALAKVVLLAAGHVTGGRARLNFDDLPRRHREAMEASAEVLELIDARRNLRDKLYETQREAALHALTSSKALLKSFALEGSMVK